MLEKLKPFFKLFLKPFCARKTYYFAVQDGVLKNLEINEDFYKQTIEVMESLHSCLNENNLDETETQKIRREKNNNLLKQNGIGYNENLKSLSEDREVKDIDSICKRAIVCLLVIQVACDINMGNDVNKSLEVVNKLIDKFAVRNAMNSKEKRIMNGTYSTQDCYDMDWVYESYWALCWVLGLVDDISDGSNGCNCREAIRFVLSSSTFEEFKGRCKIRDTKEIFDMEDLYLRYNWVINENIINKNISVGNLDQDIVVERRRGLEWVLSDIDDWYDLPLNA